MSDWPYNLLVVSPDLRAMTYLRTWLRKFLQFLVTCFWKGVKSHERSFMTPSNCNGLNILAPKVSIRDSKHSRIASCTFTLLEIKSLLDAFYLHIRSNLSLVISSPRVILNILRAIISMNSFEMSIVLLPRDSLLSLYCSIASCLHYSKEALSTSLKFSIINNSFSL